MALLPRALLRLVVLFCFLASTAHAAEKVTVLGDAGKGSGRLEFNWPRAVLYDVRVILGRLVVQFSEPGDFDFSAYRNSMPQYLGSPTVVADGAVIAFPLRIPVTLRHRQDGPRITIELHDENALPALSTAAGEDPEVAEAQDGGAAAPAPEAAPVGDPVQILDVPPPETFAGSEDTAPPADGPPLGLRIGEHPGFSRLVFDWPSEVDYRIGQREDRIFIDFAAPARLDASKFERYGLDNVYSIASEAGDEGLSVTLHLTEEWQVRHFRSGTFVAVDVVHDEGLARPVAGADPVPAMPAAEPPTQLAAQIAEEPAPDPAPLEPATETPAAETLLAEPPVAETPVAETPVAEPPVTEAALSDSDPQESDVGARQLAALDPAPAVEFSEGTAARGEGVLSLAEVGTIEEGSAQVSGRKPVLLRFDWPADPGRAAAFRRGSHLWIVFDQPVADGASRRIAETVPDLAPVRRVSAENAPDATVLRLNLPAGFVPALRREGRAWIVDLRPRAEEPESPLALEYLTDQPDPRIRFDGKGAQEVVSLRDPELGDRLEVVPLPASGQGLDRPRHFLQFRALATYQGLAFIPLSDGFAVETDGSGVVVRDETGLLVSPGSDRDRKLRDSNDFESG